MGIFDKLKSVKNFVTGGGAEVHAQLPDVLVRGESATVSIRAEIKDASMDVSSVYINVRASETIDMVVEDIFYNHINRFRSTYVDIHTAYIHRSIFDLCTNRNSSTFTSHQYIWQLRMYLCSSASYKIFN